FPRQSGGRPANGVPPRSSARKGPPGGGGGSRQAGSRGSGTTPSGPWSPPDGGPPSQVYISEREIPLLGRREERGVLGSKRPPLEEAVGDRGQPVHGRGVEFQPRCCV